MAEAYEYLDRSGVLVLAENILQKVNSRIAERIVTTVDATSDDAHVPSALAVYKAINSKTHITMQTVTGDINEQVPEEDRRTDVIYLQRDSETDTTWQMYIWNTDENGENGYWIPLGDTSIDLSNYWSKSDADTATLTSTLGVDVLEDRVSALETSVGTKVDQSDAISEESLNEILDEAAYNTSVFIPTFSLTINYVDAATGATVADAYTETGMAHGASYNVASPAVEGYTTETTEVTGTIAYADVAVTVEYTANPASDDEENV